MKRCIKSLIGNTIGATDGEIGKVKDIYFDSETWTIRYLIVETGDWLSGRKVLISPQALSSSKFKPGIFPVNLTKKQIADSPDIDTEAPVSRQQEIELYEHYRWTNYWIGRMAIGGMGTSGMITPMRESVEEEMHEKKHEVDTKSKNDPHLRSAETVIGYNVKAKDGNIGDIEDFIFDNVSWKLIYLVVDTGHWFPGKKVILSPKWVKDLDWQVSSITFNLTEHQVKNSPEFDPLQPINEAYEENFYDYYGNRSYQEKLQ